MTAATARHTGQRIEVLAEHWLQDRGCLPMFRNYSCRSGELDLVMQSDAQLIIVEVKFRRRGALVSGAESVTPSKQRRIALTTLHMLQRHPQLAELAIRFDLLSFTGDVAGNVAGNARGLQVEWIRDAFRAAL